MEAKATRLPGEDLVERGLHDLGSQTQSRRLLTTGVPWIGVRRYTLRLTPGNYAYACSVHFQTMNGTFVVTAKR